MTADTSTILIIDDDPAIVLGLRDALEKEQYHVLVCEDGKSGIETALRENPDLVLLDVNLPKIGGFDVCHELRSKGFTAPVIILSSRTEQLDKVIGLEIGADDYMTKPFDLVELRSRIRAHIRRYKELPGKVEQEVEVNKNVHRRLLAVMFTDIQNYSKMMNTDESLAMEILKFHNEFMRQKIESFDGRVIEIIGDAFLAVFESAARAVEAGITIQEGIKEHNEGLPEKERFLIRIGIHLGDVIEEADGIKGDVVNIAARIQAIAPGGGIAISETVYESVRHKVPIEVVSLGAQMLKNIQDPYTVYTLTQHVSEPIFPPAGEEQWTKVTREVSAVESEKTSAT